MPSHRKFPTKQNNNFHSYRIIQYEYLFANCQKDISEYVSYTYIIDPGIFGFIMFGGNGALYIGKIDPLLIKLLVSKFSSISEIVMVSIVSVIPKK